MIKIDSAIPTSENKHIFRKLKTFKKISTIKAVQMNEDFGVYTLEGVMYGCTGDYLCVGIKNEVWVVRKDIFKKTYREVEK